MSDQRVFLVQLVKLAFLEEEDRVPVLLLDLPELHLEGRELLPGALGNVQRAWVVVGLARSVSIFL